MEYVLPILLLAAILFGAFVVVRALHVVTIHDYERGLRFRNGRLAGLVNPGTHVTFDPMVEIRALDVRPTSVAVEGQEVLTVDGIAAKISLVARYEVGDPVAAITRDTAYDRTLYLLLQLALRDAVTRRTLEETLAARREIGPEVREAVAGRVAMLGLELLDVEVRDVMLPGELKRAYASVVAARKDGEAALERARAETAALRGLANAARAVSENPGLLQLRLLQEIGGSSGNTVVFGAPEAGVGPRLTPVMEPSSDGERVPRAGRAPRGPAVT